MDKSNAFAIIENAAHDGAFGNNPQKIPTEKQCCAGNYKVGRAIIHGIPIAIEQPRHSYRTGTDEKTGKQWSSKLSAHYGYFTGTKGADGDGVDCFIGFYPQSEYVFIINQFVGGKFDEHKVMIAYPDEHASRLAYLDSYGRGWDGLQSMIKTTVEQFKWWLKNGNMNIPLKENHLIYDGQDKMLNDIKWDDESFNPGGMTIDKLLYQMRRLDKENFLLDSVSIADILTDAEEVLTFDALTSPYSKLERKMGILKTVMERAGEAIKPVSMQLSDPFKQSGVAQVAAVFELSDGQTVSIYFHNPDTSPGKLAPDDEMISWKWLLNKKDITIVVAPEQGKDLNIKNVAARIAKLAEKNSPLFQRANKKKAEKAKLIQDLNTEITELEEELVVVRSELETAKVEAKNKQEAAETGELVDTSAAKEQQPVDDSQNSSVTEELPVAENQDNPMKAAFEAELNALKLEVDIQSYDTRLDDIAERIEKAGLLEEMDGLLNIVADQLTELMKKAEAKG